MTDQTDLDTTQDQIEEDTEIIEETDETTTEVVEDAVDEVLEETEEETVEDEPIADQKGVLVVNPSVSSEAKWYVVHTYSGHENKVAITLKQRAETAGFTDRIFKLYVPQEEKIVVTEGKKRSVEERLYPGYLIALMIMNDDTWHLIRATPGVTGFVGMGSTPTPLPEAEVRVLMQHTKKAAPKFEAKFNVGDSVKINEGPFRDFLGKVDEVNDEQGKVKVLVSVFGRETPVELDFIQVNRI